MLYVYIIHTWFTQHAYFVQLCWITCLLSLNLVWNIQHVHNMRKNWMNKLTGDLIVMLKNSNKVGIGGGKVLTDLWIIDIYPNVFNVQSSLMNIQELLQIKHITTGLTARTLSFFFFRKRGTWRNFSCSAETNAHKNQTGCYRNADFCMKMN